MDTLRIDDDGAVRTITLNRPEVRNAMNRAMLGELVQALEAANLDQDVRCVVLTGEGPVFCAGGDIKDLFTDTNPVTIRHMLSQRIRPMARALFTMDKPVLTVLNGAVAGAGLALPLASDLVLASTEARFVTAFGKIGAIPDAAVMYLMAQHLGLLRAKEIVLRARTLSAQEALDIGLYTEVVEADALAARGRELAAELAAGPTLAMVLAKHALRDAVRMPFDAFLDLEATSQALMHASHDHHEGVQAFIEKRTPQFTGR